MSIDIYTFALILGIINIIQLIIFTIEYQIHRNYDGLGWWVLWCLSSVMGFIFMLARQLQSIEKISILFQNFFLILAVCFLYIGILRFLGKVERRKLLITILLTFTLSLSYFIFIQDNINIRTIIIWLSVALISFLSAYDLNRYKSKAVELSANICIMTFIINGLFGATKVLILLNGGVIPEFTSQTFLNISSYFNLLIVTVFWTYAMIMMINQKLMSEKEKAKNYFEVIFNTSPDAILITNIANGMINTVNDNLLELTGYKAEEMIGKTTLDLNLWPSAPERNVFIDQISKQGYCFDYETTFQLKDNRKILGLVSSKVINLEENQYMIDIVRDITVQKNAEINILEKNRQLQKINNEKDKFFSIIAHDLRNPFSSFLGLTEIMADDLSKLTQNETEQIAQKMRDSARNLYGLLENLLEWSMLNQGLERFSPFQFALYPEIFECIMNYSNTSGKKNISIINEVPANEMVFSDQNMLRSLIRNLLSNALKFTPVGGAITISAETTLDKYTLIRVKDSGIGMSSDIKNSLFKLGFNTSRTGTEGELSSGLGLLLCKEFVTMHKGEIWVESEVGEGSTFFVKLPRL